MNIDNQPENVEQSQDLTISEQGKQVTQFNNPVVAEPADFFNFSEAYDLVASLTEVEQRKVMSQFTKHELSEIVRYAEGKPSNELVTQDVITKKVSGALSAESIKDIIAANRFSHISKQLGLK